MTVIFVNFVNCERTVLFSVKRDLDPPFTTLDRHGLKDLKEVMESKMASMYKEICEMDEFLSDMNGDALSALLSREDLSAPSEDFVFKSVMRWIKYRKEERLDVAAKVIGAVRLGLVDIKDVIEELNTEEMQVIPAIILLLQRTLIYNQMPSSSSGFALEKAKPRSMSSVGASHRTTMVGEKVLLFLSFTLHENLVHGTSLIIFPNSFERSYLSACHATM